MSGRTRATAAALAAGLLALGAVGCGPPGAGTISAPKEARRPMGPTTDPNRPGGLSSVIPEADIKGTKPAGRPPGRR